MFMSSPQSKRLKMFRKPPTDARYENIGHVIKKYEIDHRGRCRKCMEYERLGDNRSTSYCPKCNVSLTLTASGNSTIYENKYLVFII